MRLRFTSAHAVALGCLAAVASCFPDPLPDDGIPDSGIFVSEGGTTTNDGSASGGLTLSVTSLDFGLADCGGTAPANQKVTITNTGADEASYALLATGIGFAVVSPATGKIAGGGHVDVEVSAAAVSPFATAGGTNEGALQIVTDAPGQKTYSVGLKETAHGGQIVVTPDTADFGLVVPNGQIMDIPFTNFGNAPAKVTILTLPNGYTVNVDGGATDGTLDAGETRTLHVTLPVSGDPPSEFTGDYQIDGTPLCGGQTSGATGRYQVFAQTTSSAYPTITPGLLAFQIGKTGFTPCGQKAGSQAVTVSNPAGGEYSTVTVISTDITGPFTVTPAVDSDTASTYIDLATGMSQTFTVVPTLLSPPQSTTPGGASGTLHVALSNESEYTVTLFQTAQGAVFALAPAAALPFGDVQVDTGSSQLLGITNAGNAPAKVSLAITGSPYFLASPNGPFSVNTPAGSASIGFFPLAAGSAAGTLTFAADGAVCGLPASTTIALTGNGVAAAKPDGGTTPDGGAPIDAGSGTDSGGPVDSGIQSEGGPVAEAGPLP